jgi:XTP/dITP diphosphohydrolase
LEPPAPEGNSAEQRTTRILLASSNAGKLREFQKLAQNTDLRIELGLLPGMKDVPEYQEEAPTFGENALGKALYFSRHCNEPVLCDDSGLVVPALGGKPGVHSARYAGPDATSAQRIFKLLEEMKYKSRAEREAHFVCTVALALRGRALAIVSDRVDGVILESPYGAGGFGYDPVFYFPLLKKTFAELTLEEKNRCSHRGKAFLRLLAALPGVL